LSPTTLQLFQPIDITSAATGTNTLTTAAGAVITLSSVDATTDIFTTSAAHGLINGQLVVYNTTGTAFGGQVSGEQYAVVALTATTLKIVHNAAIDLTSTGSGTNTLTTASGPITVTGYNSATGVISTNPTPHGFFTGQAITFTSTGGLDSLISNFQYIVQ